MRNLMSRVIRIALVGLLCVSLSSCEPPQIYGSVGYSSYSGGYGGYGGGNVLIAQFFAGQFFGDGPGHFAGDITKGPHRLVAGLADSSLGGGGLAVQFLA